jgi:hypothetical protein
VPRARVSGPRSPPASSSVALRTTTSVPAEASVNSESKLARMVSLSVSVPVRNDTPRKTASSVPTSRRRRASVLRSAMAIIGRPPGT